MLKRCGLALNFDLESNPNAADESPRDALPHVAISMAEVLADDLSELANRSKRNPGWSAIQLLAQHFRGAVQTIDFRLSLLDPRSDVRITSADRADLDSIG